MTIKVSNLGKRFNREWIFKGLTAEFKSGNTYAITGPNGSGKSTLMQVLWGQVPASEGTITYEINGSVISEDDVFRHLCIAAPYMDIIEEFTLKEHVEFHFQFKKPEGDLSPTEIIKNMHLEEASNKLIRQFSSGMKQRAKLGLAMFSRCETLFLDEPSTNLDNQSIAWYSKNLMKITGKKLIFIATNQPSDYPQETSIINLSDLKKVTIPGKTWIQPK